MTDTFRALCVELLAIIPAHGTGDPNSLVIARARALLAQPEPQGPSRPAIEPVPVSERLPWPEDCDAEGCCWAIGERGNWMCVHVIGRSWTNPIYTHWLPHGALPVPGVEGKP